MNSNTAENLPNIDFEAIKDKQQATWASGDYAAIGTTIQIVGELLCESADLHAGSRVLDVAAGNGNASLAAARRFCQVTSTDYVAELLIRGKQRAAAEGLSINFKVADVENLPYANGEFDAVISTFGVMFAPDQFSAAQEMARVCRPNGTIATANWTQEGFVGQVFKIIGRHITPPAGVLPPSRWGDEAALREMFGSSAQITNIIPREYIFRYCSIDHYLDFFRSYYGPIHKAFIALGDESEGLEQDLRSLLEEFNTATDGTVRIPSAYVDVIMKAS